MRVVRPWSQEAERALLGQMIMRPANIPLISSEVAAEDWYKDEHRRLFELLCRMCEADEVIDMVVLPERIVRGGAADRFGGVGYVVGLTDAAASPENWKTYAGILVRKAKLRRCVEVAEKLIENAAAEQLEPEEIVDRATEGLGKARGFGSEETKPQTLHESIGDLLEIKERQIEQGQSPGVPTGLRELDSWLGVGLERSALTILAARPSMGKTALSINLWLRVGLRGEPVGYISAEMTDAIRLPDRILSTLTGIPLPIIREPATWTQEDWNDVVQAREVLKSRPLLLWRRRRLSVADVRAQCLRWKMKHPDMKAVFIDYLGKMTYRGDAHIGIGQNAEGLQLIGEELGIAMVVLHAVNRRSVDPKAGTKVPDLSHLAESGKLEYHLDNCLFVHRPAYFDPTQSKNLAQVVIAKQRQGQCGVCDLEWWGEMQLFRDCQGDDPQRPPGMLEELGLMA